MGVNRGWARIRPRRPSSPVPTTSLMPPTRPLGDLSVTWRRDQIRRARYKPKTVQPHRNQVMDASAVHVGTLRGSRAPGLHDRSLLPHRGEPVGEGRAHGPVERPTRSPLRSSIVHLHCDATKRAWRGPDKPSGRRPPLFLGPPGAPVTRRPAERPGPRDLRSKVAGDLLRRCVEVARIGAVRQGPSSAVVCRSLRTAPCVPAVHVVHGGGSTLQRRASATLLGPPALDVARRCRRLCSEASAR